MRRALHSTLASLAWMAVAALAGAEPVCECDAPAKPDVALESADLVFFGRASFVGEVADETGNPVEEFMEFSVDGVWKGPPQKRLRVYTRITQSQCAFVFEAGRIYLVYASRDPASHSNRFRSSICSRTRRSDHALPDLAIIGAPPHRFER
ncbi:MAG: hypothetical protein QF890_12215 [Myxococcota bacterium]|nr:hypothetical protein [Deltaproteobacteria bacterium]MCP4239782.1 hypothetical protein [bacterium]MDP6074499.1 hypothetical protein [Myxococcota bacterium]MDP6241745.1 hypothetical protein [Myxococcota bacterium]MDP7073884.1 hypothetical protein [Myxococcota bacterium]